MMQLLLLPRGISFQYFNEDTMAEGSDKFGMQVGIDNGLAFFNWILRWSLKGSFAPSSRTLKLCG